MPSALCIIWVTKTPALVPVSHAQCRQRRLQDHDSWPFSLMCTGDAEEAADDSASADESPGAQAAAKGNGSGGGGGETAHSVESALAAAAVGAKVPLMAIDLEQWPDRIVRITHGKLKVRAAARSLGLTRQAAGSLGVQL